MATNWTAIEFDYVNGSVTHEELAERYGLKSATVRQRAKRYGWAEKRNALSQAVTSKAQAELSERRKNELTKFNEDDLKVAKAIRAQVAAVISQAQQEKVTIPPRDLRSIAGALEAAQRVGRLALGATTENAGLSSPDGGPVETKTEGKVDEATVKAIVQQLKDEYTGDE